MNSNPHLCFTNSKIAHTSLKFVVKPVYKKVHNYRDTRSGSFWQHGMNQSERFAGRDLSVTMGALLCPANLMKPLNSVL